MLLLLLLLLSLSRSSCLGIDEDDDEDEEEPNTALSALIRFIGSAFLPSCLRAETLVAVNVPPTTASSPLMTLAHTNTTAQPVSWITLIVCVPGAAAAGAAGVDDGSFVIGSALADWFCCLPFLSFPSLLSLLLWW